MIDLRRTGEVVQIEREPPARRRYQGRTNILSGPSASQHIIAIRTVSDCTAHHCCSRIGRDLFYECSKLVDITDWVLPCTKALRVVVADFVELGPNSSPALGQEFSALRAQYRDHVQELGRCGTSC